MKEKGKRSSRVIHRIKEQVLHKSFLKIVRQLGKERLCIEGSMLTRLLRCFLDGKSSGLTLQLWDVLILEGKQVLIAMAHASFKIHRDEGQECGEHFPARPPPAVASCAQLDPRVAKKDPAPPSGRAPHEAFLEYRLGVSGVTLSELGPGGQHGPQEPSNLYEGTHKKTPGPATARRTQARVLKGVSWHWAPL
ncbi:uncharacterized protein [Symphalangus syndactylus]|uniref:uncharacterized protein isoform X2 n=1 Tax=Symphalangus syndactylus TaxID=9590 RepID=UPI003005244B